MASRLVILGAVVIAAAGALLPGAAAGAVQTTTWGMVAAPDGNRYRPVISHPADGSTVHDAVVVFNRSAAPLTVSLSVLGASYAAGTYQFGAPRGGLAARVSLAASEVSLGPHQAARVPVTIRSPREARSRELAAVAAEATPVQDGALEVQQRLVVLLEATPAGAPLPLVGRDLDLWGAGAAAALVGAAALAERERRHRRRCPEPAPRREVVAP